MQLDCRGLLYIYIGSNAWGLERSLSAQGILSAVDAGLHGVQLDCRGEFADCSLPVGGLTVCILTAGGITICTLTVADLTCAG